MKNYLIIFLFLCLFCVPLLFQKEKETPVEEDGEQVQQKWNLPTSITLSPSNEVVELEAYVMGVVAAEMPASYEMEALKAQAVAARTYAIYRSEKMTKPIETTTQHQVYFPVNNLADKYEQKVKEAVESTAAEMLTYNDEIISAMFHAASNGLTESSDNYSGASIPYLQSVESPEQKQKIHDFTLKQFNHLLGTTLTLQEIGQAKLTHNNTERVEEIKIAAKTWTGRQFREQLSLASTDFKIAVIDDSIKIEAKGYGHGVGMSQNGANELAQQGYSYEQILMHYYKGIEVVKFNKIP